MPDCQPDVDRTAALTALDARGGADAAERAPTVESPAPEKRRPGRPKGYPRTGGRKPGTPNKVNQDIRAIIETRGRPIELLCDIARGRKIRVGPQIGPGTPVYAYPSLAERRAAAAILANKIVPDLKAAELTGKDGAALIPAPTPEETAAKEAALARIGAILRGEGVPK